MKFEFEIDVKDFYDDEGYGRSFTDMILEEAAKQVAAEYRNEIDITYYRSKISQEIDRIVKENEKEIIETIIERVSGMVARKKRIAAETPKASVIAAIDKENEEYFITLIDKAIAKRFK